ncbi:unnamed protein product [Brachionus calyciflorus]|uniref:Uncharacterized protein n=1 Tax=Brachionus calyciflorus TaxID=104777 RepID=A0A814DMI3_9BILA|nr:unnamed protein product [Brachionus calyciflorus]
MPKSKAVVVVDSAGGTDDEALLDLDSEVANNLVRNGQKLNEKVEIKNIQDLNGNNKELYLLKLPKELIKYQKEHKNLKINLNDVKSGEKFTINNIDYEAVMTKSKVSFNCLCKNDDTFQAINKFKYIIQVQRCIEIPEIIAPEKVYNKVEVPNVIENYIEKKQNKLNSVFEEKPKKSKNLKRVLEDEIVNLDKTLGKKSKTDKKK